MKHIIELLIVISVILACSCRGPKELRPEDEEFAEFIGASNPRLFYEKNGFLPHVYCDIDNSTIMSIDFIGTNLMQSNNKQVFSVTPHFTTCPYITIDSLVYMNMSMDTTSIAQLSTLQRLLGHEIKYIDLCAGDTIFTDNQMRIMWVNECFLRARYINRMLTWQHDLYHRFLEEYFKHSVKYSNYQHKHRKK
ncbi:MAG: hypothetical protein IKR25_10920 [Muribaculaceae bacterium]|nr:hypothetical protein [Muribaculaceae bacterium]